MPTSTFTHRIGGTNNDETKPSQKEKRIGRIRSKDLTRGSTAGVFQTCMFTRISDREGILQ